MGSLICLMFRPCRWLWHFDTEAWPGMKTAEDPLGQYPRLIGVYQCTRCKAISLGAPRA